MPDPLVDVKALYKRRRELLKLRHETYTKYGEKSAEFKQARAEHIAVKKQLRILLSPKSPTQQLCYAPQLLNEGATGAGQLELWQEDAL